jgi:hypothetical protein
MGGPRQRVANSAMQPRVHLSTLKPCSGQKPAPPGPVTMRMRCRFSLQELLLPPSLREWLPEGHLAWFVIDAVAEMDLTAFYAAYRDPPPQASQPTSPENHRFAGKS